MLLFPYLKVLSDGMRFLTSRYLRKTYATIFLLIIFQSKVEVFEISENGLLVCKLKFIIFLLKVKTCNLCQHIIPLKCAVILKDMFFFFFHFRLSIEDGVQFLKRFVNVDGNVASLSLLVEKVYGNPLALLCNAVMLKKKLFVKQVQSIDDVVKEICNEIDRNVNQVIAENQHLSAFTSTYSGRKLVTIESVVAILMKDIMNESPYLYNGIDLMAAMAPGTAIPQQVITRHLASSFYKLPSLAKPPNILDFMSKQKRDADDVKQNADEFDPKGKAWSNKNLVHYIQKVEEFFETVYKTLKEIYFLVYGELPELPKGDDGMGMFADCVLIQSSVVQPGGMTFYFLWHDLFVFVCSCCCPL